MMRIAFLLPFLFCPLAQAGVIDLTTADAGSFDAIYNDAGDDGFDSGTGDDISFGDAVLRVEHIDPVTDPPPGVPGSQKRAVLEFKVDNVLSGATINSATLTLLSDSTGYSASGGNEPDIELYIYNGDGAATDSDYTQTATLVASFSNLQSDDDINQAVTSQVQTLINANATHIGFLVLNTDSGPPPLGSAYGIASAESDAFEFNPPTLSIDFTAVPEPSSLVLFGAVIAGTVCLRKRRSTVNTDSSHTVEGC